MSSRLLNNFVARISTHTCRREAPLEALSLAVRLASIVALCLTSATQSLADELQSVAPEVGPYVYGFVRCDTFHSNFGSEGGATETAVNLYYGQPHGCSPTLFDPGAWGNGGACGSPGGPPGGGPGLMLLGQEVSNTRGKIVSYLPPSCQPPAVHDGILIGRSRPVSCPLPSDWNSSACTFPPPPFVVKDKNNKQCPPNGSNPIHTALGFKLQTETDFALPGSFGIRFDRFYSSARDYAHFVPLWERASIGAHWRTSFDRAIRFTQSPAVNTAYVLRPDGDRFYFNQVGTSTVFVGDPDVTYVLTQLRDGSGTFSGWTLVTPADETELYDTDGKVQSVTNRSGRKVTFDYNAENQLTTVRDDQGRAVTLTYEPFDANPNRECALQPKQGLLTDVTLPDGSNYHYDYTIVGAGNPMFCPNDLGTPYLTSVTPPDSPPRQYLYGEGANGQAYQLTGIVDENGARYATYQYDSSGRAWLSVHGDVNSTTNRVEFTYNGDINTNPAATVTTKQWVNADGSNAAQRTYSFDTKVGVVKQATVDQPCDGCGGGGAAARTYDAAGYQTSSTDFNGNITTTAYNETLGVETMRVEATTNASTTPPQGARRTETDWNFGSLRVPTERRVYGSTGVKEAQTDWVYNTRGQVLARCEIDPADTSGYICSNTTAPPTNAKVRRWTYTYCETVGGACPILGLLLTEDGPRTDVSDVTTYAYYLTADQSDCALPSNDIFEHGPEAPPPPQHCHQPGDLYTVTNALGHVTTYLTYDRNGRATRTVDSHGTYTDMQYGTRGWLLERIVHPKAGDPSDQDAITTFGYDHVGNLVQTDQSDGSFIQYSFDNAHRLTSISDGLNNRIEYTLDALGNRTNEATYDPDNTLTRALGRHYDLLNHLTATLNAAGNAVRSNTNPLEAPPIGRTYTNGYDGNGNSVYSKDGLNVGTEQQYDGLNRLVAALQDHEGSGGTVDTTTAYEYDARNNLRKVTDPNGLPTSYTYDGLNNLTNLVSPDTGSSSYTFDEAGNRKTQTDARGVTATYGYDALNRLTGISYPTTSLNVTYLYDQPGSACHNTGRLTKIIDSSGSTAYCYDARGNVLSKVQVTNGISSTTTYTYTLTDRLASIAYPSGAYVEYLRDGEGRIINVTYTPNGGYPSALVSGVTYLPYGPVNAITFGNGRTLTKSYDQDYAIDQVFSSDTGGLTIDATVDVMGNLTNASSTIGASPPTQKFFYDPLYRVTDVKNGSNASLLSLTYNQTGDRLSKTPQGQASQTYTYASGTHFLNGVAGASRTPDLNGNTHTANGVTFAYDDRNRLTSAAGVTYNYNGRGERVYKSSPGTLFTYAENGQLLGEYNTSGVAQKEYIPMDGILVGVTTGGNLYYVETDQLGTPRQVILPGASTASDTTVWKWDYFANNSAFGENTPSVQAVALNLRFPGQYFDAETGLVYNYFRNYESATGRYAESDPIGLRGGVSSYGYVGQSPINALDLTGTMEWTGSFDGYGFAALGAIGGYTFQLETDCICGKKGISGGTAKGGGVSLGARWLPNLPSGTGSDAVFVDTKNDEIDPHVFDGKFAIGSFLGFSFIRGYGCSTITLGGARNKIGTRCSSETGLDITLASFIVGTSYVDISRTPPCQKCDKP